MKIVNVTSDGTFVEREYTDEEYKEGLRAMFIPVENVMENTLVPGPGFMCDSKETAVPECFDAEGWSEGAFGKIFKKATTELGVPVIAMTKANFSDLVYKKYKVR
jgi:hypothetical protein